MSRREHVPRARQWVRRNRWWLLILTLGLAIRLGLAPYHGFFADLETNITWGNVFRAHPADPYSASQVGNPLGQLFLPPTYPPLMLYIFGGLTSFWSWLGLAGWVPLTFDDKQSSVLPVVMKLPMILGDVACAWAILGIGRRIAPERWTLTVVALYMFSPPVLMDGALWGQTDTLAAGVALLGLAWMLRQRSLAGGGMLAAASMLKPQPAIFTPLAAAYAWRPANPRRLAFYFLGAVACVVLVWTPLLATHPDELRAFVDNVSTVIRLAPDASSNAYNLWWLLGAARVPHAHPYLGPLSIDVIGASLIAAIVVYAVASIVSNPSDRTLLSSAAVVGTAFFFFGSLQHERYLVQVLPMIASWALYEARVLWLFLIVSLTSLLNMLLVVLPTLPESEHLGLPAAVFQVHHLGRPIALANLVVLGAMLIAQRQTAR